MKILHRILKIAKILCRTQASGRGPRTEEAEPERGTRKDMESKSQNSPSGGRSTQAL